MNETKYLNKHSSFSSEPRLYNILLIPLTHPRLKTADPVEHTVDTHSARLSVAREVQSTKLKHSQDITAAIKGGNKMEHYAFYCCSKREVGN